MAEKDEADAKLLLNTRIPLTWVFAVSVPLIWSAVKLNYTVENLVVVTSEMTKTISQINNDKSLADRERDRTNNRIDLLGYQLEALQNTVENLKDKRHDNKNQ